MRISEQLTRSMFEQYLNKRDNNKGRVSEADFADWSWTTQRIIDRLHSESKMVDEYSIADYELWEKVEGLITPREIRLQDEAVFLNVKDNSISREELWKFEEAQWSTSNKNEATYEEEKAKYVSILEKLISKHNTKTKQQINKLEKLALKDKDSEEDQEDDVDVIDRQEEINRLKNSLIDWDAEIDDVCEIPSHITETVSEPDSRAARLLSPSAYKDVQRRMLKQLSIKDGKFVKFTDKYTDRATLTLSDLSSYSIEGKTLNQPLDGFRPIALKKEFGLLLDMEEFRGKAETNFLNWFRSLME